MTYYNIIYICICNLLCIIKWTISYSYVKLPKGPKQGWRVKHVTPPASLVETWNQALWPQVAPHTGVTPAYLTCKIQFLGVWVFEWNVLVANEITIWWEALGPGCSINHGMYFKPGLTSLDFKLQWLQRGTSKSLHRFLNTNAECKHEPLNLMVPAILRTKPSTFTGVQK